MKIYKSISALVGKTPIIELTNLENLIDTKAKLLAKVEFFNPAGSIKDRAALNIINAAEKEGRLNKHTAIIEATSGNTGIGLAAICASRGYRLIIVMPSNMSVERIKLMRAYGAEVILTDGALGMKGAIDKAEQLHKDLPESIMAGQFENAANPEAHYLTTGPEIWQDTDGKVDILISAVGTGGTISGTGKYLKEQNPNIKIIAVEPQGSPYLSKGRSGSHKIQGIGAGFVPDTLNTNIYDEIITVSDDDAMQCARDVAKTEGLLVGISSGSAIAAAKEVASRPENVGKNIVMILPDTGERYLSSELFNK